MKDALISYLSSLISSSLIPHPSSLILQPSSLILHPSSFILHPSSFIPHPSSFILPMTESDPEIALALQHAQNRLKLAEDYCDMFDRLVDMSDITQFGDEGGTVAGPRPRGHAYGL